MVLWCTLHGSSEPSQWARDLSLVEFVINSSPSLSTGYAPFYLNYGYYPATPLDLIQDTDTTAVEGVNQFVQRIEKTFAQANQMLQRAQERQKVQADQRRREQTFAVGEQVLLSTEHLQLKHAPVRKLRKRFVVYSSSPRELDRWPMNWNYPKPGDFTQYFTPVCFAPSTRLSGLPGHRCGGGTPARFVFASLAEVLAAAGPVACRGSVSSVDWAMGFAPSGVLHTAQDRRRRVGETRHRPAHAYHALDSHCTQIHPRTARYSQRGVRHNVAYSPKDVYYIQ